MPRQQRHRFIQSFCKAVKEAVRSLLQQHPCKHHQDRLRCYKIPTGATTNLFPPRCTWILIRTYTQALNLLGKQTKARTAHTSGRLVYPNLVNVFPSDANPNAHLKLGTWGVGMLTGG